MCKCVAIHYLTKLLYMCVGAAVFSSLTSYTSMHSTAMFPINADLPRAIIFSLLCLVCHDGMSYLIFNFLDAYARLNCLYIRVQVVQMHLITNEYIKMLHFVRNCVFKKMNACALLWTVIFEFIVQNTVYVNTDTHDNTIYTLFQLFVSNCFL